MPAWYDVFSLFYDRALEDLYRPFRPSAVAALRLRPGERVLDLPCGTGPSFEALISAVGPSGQLLAMDRSAGMLARARRRTKLAGWDNVLLERAEANDLTPELIERLFGDPHVDAVHCSLGLTALRDWETAFDGMFGILRHGGRFVLFDVFAAERTRQTRSVEFLARADLSREAWRPLMHRCVDFERTVLPADPKIFGGELYVASGTRR